MMVRTPPGFGVRDGWGVCDAWGGWDGWGVGDVGEVWLAAGAMSATATRTTSRVENSATHTRDMGTSRVNRANRSLRENAGADKPVAAAAREKPVRTHSTGGSNSNQTQEEVDRVEQPARQSAD